MLIKKEKIEYLEKERDKSMSSLNLFYKIIGVDDDDIDGCELWTEKSRLRALNLHLSSVHSTKFTNFYHPLVLSIASN